MRRPAARLALGLAVVVAALAALPMSGSAYLVTFTFTVLIAYVLGQSWDWIAGEMGYVNLGHYCFYGVGAYAFSLVLVGRHPAAFAFVVAALVAVLLAVLIAVPLFRLRGDYFAFGTLALLPLAEVLAYNLAPLTRGADGVVLPVARVLGAAYALALGLCVVTFATTLLVNRARFGYALKAIRNDEEVAEVIGVRVLPAKVKVLALSGVFAALAGAIQAWQMSYIDPPTVFGLNVALVPIAMVLFGGSGLRWGPLAGVIVLASVQQWMLVNVSMLQTTVYGAIILLIGRFMPGGVLRSALVRRSRWLAWLGREHHEFLSVPVPVTAAEGGTAPGTLPLPARRDEGRRPLLRCEHLRKEFGGNVAIDDVSLDVRAGEIVGLIGANGSGKTTLFNCISKVLEPTAGVIRFDGRDLRALRRDEIVHLGVGRTYQIPRPFGDLTVQENIAMPLMFQGRRLAPGAALQEARAFVDYAELGARISDRADALSLQQKKALEFARALACRPSLLLVDEVASGLTPAEVNRFVRHIRHIRDTHGVTVIWVEHIFSALAQVVDRVVVLEQGKLVADGTLQQVVKDERVLRTYLGSAASGAA